MHGPAVRGSLTQLLVEYRNWLNEQIKAADQACVAVLYASAYGNTASLAQVRTHTHTDTQTGLLFVYLYAHLESTYDKS